MPRVLKSYAKRWRLVSYNLHFHCDSQFKPSLDLVTYREDDNGKSRMVLMKNFLGFFYCYVEVPDYVEDIEIMCFFLCVGGSKVHKGSFLKWSQFIIFWETDSDRCD